MARVVPFHPPLHRGHGTAVGALVFVLSFAGAVSVWAAHRARRGLRAWAAVRRRRATERTLAELALHDPRLAAEFVALQQQHERKR